MKKENKILKKDDIVDRMSDILCITKKDCGVIYNVFLSIIIQEVFLGNIVKLIGFGEFGLKNQKEMRRRNPKTGEYYIVKAHKKPYFKMGKAFKRGVIKESKKEV